MDDLSKPKPFSVENCTRDEMINRCREIGLNAELEHASIWYDFMRNKAKAMRSMYESKSEPMPEYIETRITDMTDYYMEKSAKVRYMLDSNRR